jgi:arylsulfatase A-like enzyme
MEATKGDRPERRRRLLRAIARLRRERAALVLALPAALVVGVDLTLRGQRLLDLPAKYFGSYLVAVAESAVVWGLLLACASARRGALRWVASGLFVTLATLVVGTQLYFYDAYSTYLNLDATLFGTSMADSLFGQLSADGANFVLAVLPPMAVAAVLVWLGRRMVRTRARTVRRAALLIPAVLAGALAIPCSYRAVQGSTPDVIYFHAIGGLIKQLTGFDERAHVRPKRRAPDRLPALAPRNGRNVLLVITESVRRDVACPSHRDDCPAMPFSNLAAPERVGLHQMRSSSSTTAIQMAVLWSGLPPTAGREPLHRAPLLFEYAHAAGYETAYWSSHHMLFANSRLYVQDLPTRFQCGATHLDPLADVDVGADDRLLSSRVIEELPQLREPFFAVVHYANTHVPYLVDEDDAPFSPHRKSKAESDNELYKNHYKNAVYRQDRAVGELLDSLRVLPSFERTVVVYTSDHGEQFREHGQLGHTGSVFDVEIHVPAWIDGALGAEERSALAGYAHAPTFHTDLTPTILDLMGLWDAPELERFREAMAGSSLLRPGRPERTMALTNCSGVWGCAFENWGVMRGFKKVLAREWERSWLCYDVARDPAELSPLPLGECGSLVTEAQKIHGRLPGH